MPSSQGFNRLKSRTQRIAVRMHFQEVRTAHRPFKLNGLNSRNKHLISLCDKNTCGIVFQFVPLNLTCTDFDTCHWSRRRHSANKVYSALRSDTRWTACAGCRRSKMLMRYPLPGRANELLAVSRLRARAAAGPLTGDTALTADLYKLGHTEWQECRLCGYDKEDSVSTVCHCPVLACKIYRIWGKMFLKHEDLEKVRVSSLLSLVANTGLGLAP